MSYLSFIEKLFEGGDVEWKELGNSINFQRGKRLVKSQLEESGEYAVFQNSMTPLGYYHESNVSAKSAFVICAGAAGEIGFSDDSFWAADDVYYAEQSEILNSKYLYHFLLTQKHKIASQVRRASIPRLSKSAIEKLIVPIPCPDNPEKSLAIQAEIVRILDAFTAMTAELTAELNMRKKQYNYYRDQLLSFEEGDFEWKALGEVAKIQRGASPRPIAKFITDDDGGVPWIKIGDTETGSKYVEKTAQKITKEGAKKSRVLNKGDFIISNSMSFGRPYILNIRGAIHDGWASVSEFGDKLNSDFLYHYLSSQNVQNYWVSKINSGSVSNLNADIIKTLPIPIPCPDNLEKSLAEQARIASILDKFDTLTTSLQEGLPREIELRQKQYEYYRDLLLSFPASPAGGPKSHSDEAA
ncbi:restriction endonuclease subunit S [Shewanella oncorhynchi]|uniref:restriction endonuclease subunit S n=1 Tax=Shewanella oncorhynchi TaxID=2726434 RepID=UPI002A52FB99|nr:restriction endonuclease subunit S [Vibrio metschnikovii]